MTACGMIVVLMSMLGSPNGQVSAASAPADLERVNPAWLKPTQRNAEQLLEALKSAYELDQTMVERLRAELDRRLAEQVTVEREYQKDRIAKARELRKQAGGAANVSTEAQMKLRQELKGRLETMPLNEKRVTEWLESQLPAEQVAAGRPRLQELWQRREAQRSDFMNESTERSGAKERNAKDKTAETAPLSPAGKPMPTGPKGAEIAAAQPPADAGTTVQVDQGVTDAPQKPVAPPKIDTSKPRTEPLVGKPGTKERMPAKPGEVAGPMVKPVAPVDKGEKRPGSEPSKGKEAAATAQQAPPAPAPPLDDWDKHVISVAQKYGFTDAQITKARGILGDLRNRAYQYRLSHANDYAAAELMTDAKARADRLKQLNAAMDALFAELKARLESLPTVEQKQKAEAPPKKAGEAPATKKTPAAAPKTPEPKKGK